MQDMFVTLRAVLQRFIDLDHLLALVCVCVDKL